MAEIKSGCKQHSCENYDDSKCECANKRLSENVTIHSLCGIKKTLKKYSYTLIITTIVAAMTAGDDNHNFLVLNDFVYITER